MLSKVNWLTTCLVAGVLVAAIAPMAVLLYHNGSHTEQTIASVRFEAETPDRMEVGQTFAVKACRVIDGYRFEVCLENGKWFETHLALAAKEEAAAVVVGWLNSATPPAPTITLLRPVGPVWVVDFRLCLQGKSCSMADMLRANGLALYGTR